VIDVVHADSLAWIQDKDPRDWALLLFDPPYGIAYEAGSAPRVRFHDPIVGDETTLVRDECLAWWGEGAAAVFGTWKVEHYGKPRAQLIWDKMGAAGMGDMSLPWKPDFEEIAIYGPGWHGARTTSRLSHVPLRGADGKHHPHQKPVPLLQSILDKAPPGRVLDLTAGSGSTGVACARLDRPCTIVEIDERWIPTIRRRIATEGAQRPLFS
jgi:16S rRNA G966 N2-methylase RsmD